MWTVNDVMLGIANEIDQSDSAPATTEADWTIRLGLVNRSLRDWSESYDWDDLKAIHNGLISTSTGNASYALPNDFRKLDGYPKIVSDGLTTYEFPHIDPSKNRRFTDTDKYVNILGNESDGHVMYIASNTLASGASVQFTYYSYPATLATTSQVAEIPDATYLVQRTLYYMLKSKEDGRFPEAKVEADRILARMIENQNTRGLGHADRRVSVGPEPYYNWRVGKDG